MRESGIKDDAQFFYWGTGRMILPFTDLEKSRLWGDTKGFVSFCF